MTKITKPHVGRVLLAVAGACLTLACATPANADVRGLASDPTPEEWVLSGGHSGPACTPMPAGVLGAARELATAVDALPGAKYCQVYYLVDASFPAHELPFTK
ncbi:hypothetical protein AB0H77_29110 [Streptomyces sp. NPDC050844]|uniref:hypothetical protein n=1 Tax=Streptomyces sp. NPDC050844 TaxID=3155790 RepID=UPI0033C72164